MEIRGRLRVFPIFSRGRKKRFGEKAGMTFLETMGAVILTVVAVIIVILGYRAYFAPVSDLPGTLPSSLSARAITCTNSQTTTEQVGKSIYCGFGAGAITVAGKKQWVNCEYIKRFYAGDFELVSCGENQEKNYCVVLGDNSAIVNGQSCSQWAAGTIPTWKSENWENGKKPTENAADVACDKFCKDNKYPDGVAFTSSCDPTKSDHKGECCCTSPD